LSDGFLERRFKMIVSPNPIPGTPRWLFVVILLCAVALLPLGVAYAQDFEAVGKRLRAAVAAGELTAEQARAMMAALRKAGGADVRAVGIRLRKAVAAGELTAEQARTMMATLEKASGARRDRGADRVQAYLTKVKKDLEAAVRAGKITREQAAKRYQGAEKAVKERMAAGRRQPDAKRISREDFVRAAAEIRKAVAAGKISEEAARTRLAEMRRAMADRGAKDRKRESRAEYRAIEQRIRSAVEAGKMSKEEAERKLIELRKRMFGLGRSF